MDFLQKIVQIGFPVVLGLLGLIVLIAILDRRRSDEKRHDAQGPEGRRRDKDRP